MHVGGGTAQRQWQDVLSGQSPPAGGCWGWGDWPEASLTFTAPTAYYEDSPGRVASCLEPSLKTTDVTHTSCWGGQLVLTVGQHLQSEVTQCWPRPLGASQHGKLVAGPLSTVAARGCPVSCVTDEGAVSVRAQKPTAPT